MLPVAVWIQDRLEHNHVDRAGTSFGRLQMASGGLEARESLSTQDEKKWDFILPADAPALPTVQIAGVLLTR